MNKLNQYLGSFVVSLGSFSLGVCLGWNSSSSELLKDYVNGDTLELGLVGGIFNLGVCMGLISVPFILRGFSRIGMMMLTVPILFLGWCCIIFAGQTVPLLLLGRTLCGYSGTFSLLAPIYIGEISSKEIRGKLLAISQLMINMGIMSSYTAAYFTSEEKTIWLYSIICALSNAPVALVILMPETPAYHLLMGNEERAKISLKYYRGDHFDGLDTEMQELKNLIAFKESNQITLNVLKDKEVLRSLIASFGVMVMHQFSGISPFIFYTLTIFHAGGSADISSRAQTLVVGFAQIIASIIAIIFIDILGRKPLLIASSFLTGGALALLGWYFAIQQEDPEYADKLSWMPLAWITLFFASFNLGVGPIAWVYLGEIFPFHIRLEAGTMMCILNWLLSLILTLSFGEIIDLFGQSYAMWFFAGFSFAGTIFTSIFIKETKLNGLNEYVQETTSTLDSTQL